MKVVVIDDESIYSVVVRPNASSDDVLSAYMRASGKALQNSQGEQYTYRITPHSATLYSVRRKAQARGEMHVNGRGMSFILLNVSKIDIIDWWVCAYPILEQIVTVAGASAGVVKFLKWLRASLRKENKNEYKWVQEILANDSWSSSELSKQLSMSREEAKRILRGFGFIWDSHRQRYIATDITKRLRLNERESDPGIMQRLKMMK